MTGGPVFAAEVRRRGTTVVIDLHGQVNALARDEIDQALEEILGTAPRRILLNFAATAFINSTGIALVVGMLGRARASDVKVEACGLSDHYREIFEITRLVDFMVIHSDEASAFGGEEGENG